MAQCNCYFWGYMKDAEFLSPLPTDTLEQQRCITEAIALVPRNILAKVREGMEYRISAV
jgi:hypothetical protein